MIICGPDDIMNPEALECEDDGGEAGPLDLWHCVFKHALLPEFVGVDTKALPRRSSPGTARSLLGLTPVNNREADQIKTNSNSQSNYRSRRTSQQRVELYRIRTLKWAPPPVCPCLPSSYG